MRREAVGLLERFEDSLDRLVNGAFARAFKADYTHFPDSITEELNRHNRAGVPLVLIYPADTNKPPFVPYRGVARPGVCFAMEQVIDAIATSIARLAGKP